MLYSKNDKDICHNDNEPCHDDNKSCQGLCAGRKMMNNMVLKHNEQDILRDEIDRYYCGIVGPKNTPGYIYEYLIIQAENY